MYLQQISAKHMLATGLLAEHFHALVVLFGEVPRSLLLLPASKVLTWSKVAQVSTCCMSYRSPLPAFTKGTHQKRHIIQGFAGRDIHLLRRLSSDCRAETMWSRRSANHIQHLQHCRHCTTTLLHQRHECEQSCANVSPRSLTQLVPAHKRKKHRTRSHKPAAEEIESSLCSCICSPLCIATLLALRSLGKQHSILARRMLSMPDQSPVALPTPLNHCS